MTNPRQQGAYPSLVPGNKDGARDSKKPWDVIELDDGLVAGRTGPSTDKGGRVLTLPKPVLQHDWWIRQHELTHVGRPHIVESKNQLRNLIRVMLEEVAVDGQSLYRDLLDLRQARDFFDWSQFGRPQDVYKAAGMFLQTWTSAQVSPDPSLHSFHQDCVEVIQAGELAEPKIAGVLLALRQAAEAVFADYSSGNCEDWADIVTSKLLGVPPEEIPDAPQPPSGAGTGADTDPGSGQPGAGSSAGSSGAQTADESATPGGQPGGPGAGSESDVGDATSDSPGACPVCDGSGLGDDTGAECGACDGTGDADPPVDDPAGLDAGANQTAPGPGDGSDGDAGPDAQGSRASTWDDAPIPVDKARQNQASEFGFDPLGKYKIDPNQEPDGPGERESPERKLVTQQQLQDSIDQERLNRKQGEASQAEELTFRTPHGAVDVHRHTLSKGVAQSVALAWRSSEMGATVRYPSQLFNGGRVFAKRAPGGSIILDCSGSMSWHTQHIIEAQKIMPNLYVAGYDHHATAGYWAAKHGHTVTDIFIARYCVLAAKGQLDPDGMLHLKDEWQHTGGNSGSDPAALFYAARAAVKPIVWVSDGMVSYGEAQAFYKQVDGIMRQHKIVRVLTIEDAIDYLLGKAVPGWHQCATVDTHWVRLGQSYMGRSISPENTENEAYRWTQLRANTKKH